MKFLSKLFLGYGIALILGASGASDCDIYTVSQVFKQSLLAFGLFAISYVTYFIAIATE